MASKKNQCTLTLPIRDKNALQHILNAERELGKAGIHFDTGAGFGGRDWELDWSLKDGKLHCHK